MTSITKDKSYSNYSETGPTDGLQVYYNFEQMSYIPDNKDTTVYRNVKDWTTGIGSWQGYADVPTIEDGFLTWNKTVTNEYLNLQGFGSISGKKFAIQFIVESYPTDTGTMQISFAQGGNLYHTFNAAFRVGKMISFFATVNTDYAYNSIFITPGNYTSFPNKVKIKNIYFGDGTYATPLRDCSGNGNDGIINYADYITESTAGKNYMKFYRGTNQSEILLPRRFTILREGAISFKINRITLDDGMIVATTTGGVGDASWLRFGAGYFYFADVATYDYISIGNNGDIPEIATTGWNNYLINVKDKVWSTWVNGKKVTIKDLSAFSYSLAFNRVGYYSSSTYGYGGALKEFRFYEKGLSDSDCEIVSKLDNTY